MERLARQLAERHTIVKTPNLKQKQKVPLLAHLKNWEKTLQAAYISFKVTSSDDLAFSHAGEWMLDNYYVVEQTLNLIEESLPDEYFEQLPKLDATTLKGHPRIFALAWEWVRYNYGQIDLSQIMPFVMDYQEIAPLTIGELWALPIMLRISILERLAMAVTEITQSDPPESLNATPILSSTARVMDEVVVANCFISLRLLAVADWKSFFEQVSRVEQILRSDPAGIYTDMDFETRNHYRSVVEELARHSHYNEEDVARAAIELVGQVQDEAAAPPPQGEKCMSGFI